MGVGYPSKVQRLKGVPCGGCRGFDFAHEAPICTTEHIRSYNTLRSIAARGSRVKVLLSQLCVLCMGVNEVDWLESVGGARIHGSARYVIVTVDVRRR